MGSPSYARVKLYQLADAGKLQRELRLLSSGIVLVQNMLGYGLVNLFHSDLVSLGSSALITCGDSSVESLQIGPHRILENLIVQSLNLCDLNTLFGRFDVRHESTSLTNHIQYELL